MFRDLVGLQTFGTFAPGLLALSFPDAEAFVVAAVLPIGRYSGYRLGELVRFRQVSRAGMPGA